LGNLLGLTVEPLVGRKAIRITSGCGRKAEKAHKEMNILAGHLGDVAISLDHLDRFW
jgi:hypothetical protein